MLPSVRLIFMLLAAAPIFFGGAVYDPLFALGFLYLAVLAVYVLLDALLLPPRRSLTIARSVPRRISLSVPLPISYTVHNGGHRAVTVALAEDLPEGLEVAPPTCSGRFAPGARGHLEVRLTAQRRGQYQLGAVDVRLLPRWGLLYRQFRLDLPAELQVFPNLVDLKCHALQIRKGLAQEQGMARLWQAGQGSEFESLRSFTEGDDLSRIDWKATAKRSRLIVRNFEPERQQNVLVALDTGRTTAGEFQGLSRLDYLVNATLMLAYATLSKGDRFSLISFSDRIESYLPPVRGVKNIDLVARALYKLEPRLVEADYSAACRFLDLKNRRRSLICLMTDVIDRQSSDVIVSYMRHFARRHLPLIVTLADADVQRLGAAPLAGRGDPYVKAAAIDVLTAREETLAAMRQFGVMVLDVPPPALTVELLNRYLLIKATRRL
jgi:uncharacterized protein (DUF58 family)